MKLNRILNDWGFDEFVSIIEEKTNGEIEKESHVWTVDDRYLLKMTHSKEEVLHNTSIAMLLNETKIPAQKVVLTQSGKSFIQIGQQYYALFTKLKGDVLKDYFEGDYIKRAHYLGACLGDLHERLKSMSNQVNTINNDMDEELSGWVKETIDQYLLSCDLGSEELNQFKQIYTYVYKEFPISYAKLPRQLIHRDIHGENMIFNDGKLVGYIDFDLSQINARLFDLCYLCTGALAQSFNDEEKLLKWKPFAQAVIKGYDEENPLTETEKESIQLMFYGIELMMIVFFAKEGYREIANSNIKMMSYIESIW